MAQNAVAGKIAAFLLVPAVLVCLLFFVERWLEGLAPSAAVPTVFDEPLKKSVELSLQLATTFITLASSLIAGIAYYVKSRPDFQPFGRFAVACAVGGLTMAGASLFFGHLWIAQIRNELALERFAPTEAVVAVPERFQYFCFVVALAWFVMLVIEREIRRRDEPTTA